MKIRKLYLKDVLEKYEEICGVEAKFNDETGKYYLCEINCVIKSWNNKLELDRPIFNPEKLEKFVKIIDKLKFYDWLKIEETKDAKQNDEN